MFRFNALYCDFIDAWQCLWYRKFRTILSALGIAIGTMALVSMLSISEGARLETEKQISSLGINTIRIENEVDALINNNNEYANLATGVTNKDYLQLKREFPSAIIAKFKRVEQQSVFYKRQSVSAEVLLVNQDWFSAENIKIRLGRMINQQDIELFQQVCMVGSELAKELNLQVLSQLSWEDNSCHVVGILAEKGSLLVEGSSLASINFDRSIVAPINQYSAELNELSGITLQLKESKIEEIYLAEKKVKKLVNRLHKVADFKVITPASLLDKAKQEQMTFTLIMGTIAGLSLLVGGIGIMNVMLAHVAEQSREIGLRITLGASKRRVLQLFLLYSITLTGIGTVFGVFSGMLLALMVQLIALWPVNFSIFSLTIGPIFSLLAGVVFGLYPAFKASQVLPNTALRQN